MGIWELVWAPSFPFQLCCLSKQPANLFLSISFCLKWHSLCSIDSKAENTFDIFFLSFPNTWAKEYLKDVFIWLIRLEISGKQSYLLYFWWRCFCLWLRILQEQILPLTLPVGSFSRQKGKQLFLSHQLGKINLDCPTHFHHYMANRWGNNGNSERQLFSWAPKSLQMLTVAMKLKDAFPLEEKLWPTWTAY